MVTDPIGDMLARIRNAQMRQRLEVWVPASRLKEAVLGALVREGYLRGFIREGEAPKQQLKVELKYFNGKPVIQHMKRISKPSIHRYTSLRDMGSVSNGLGNFILSTSVGVLSDREARNRNVGGKILLRVR